MNPHPSSLPSTTMMSSSLGWNPKISENSSVLWQVTLGFFPIFVNWTKRLSDTTATVVVAAKDSQSDEVSQEHPTKKEDKQASSTSPIKGLAYYIVETSHNDKDGVPDLESVSDISASSYSTCSSRHWANADPELKLLPSVETTLSINDNEHLSISSNTSTAVTYSGSYYNFARTPEENNRKKATATRQPKVASRCLHDGNKNHGSDMAITDSSYYWGHGSI